MNPVLPVSLLCLIAVTGCGGGGEQAAEQLFAPFSQRYSLSDFKPGAVTEYWEIRRGALSAEDVKNYQVIDRFDEKAYIRLSSAQANLIGNANSQNGFAWQCMPTACPVYGVALQGDQISILDSVEKLIGFFGDIDTEAELFILLEYTQTYAENTHPDSFISEGDGFLVELSWDTLCQLRGKDLVKVHKDGKIEKIREIARENYQSCV